jgi:dienelactone hydrolase
MKTRGITRQGIIGFCWGCWYIFKATGLNDVFQCGVNCHPSLSILNFYGEDILKVTEEVKCPQLLLPAGNDIPEVKPDGAVTKILKEKFGEKTKCVEFEKMVHGWVNRSDLKEEENKKAVEEALKLAVDYLRENL